MKINIDDNKIFQNYILCSLKNNPNIDLLFNASKCNDEEKNIPLENSDIFLNNLQLLLNYLIQNNIQILNWTLKSSNNLFLNDVYFQIIQLFEFYFLKINKKGNINYHTNFLTKEILNKKEQYNNINLNLYYKIYLNNDYDLNVLNYIDNLEIIITSTYIQHSLNQYKYLMTYIQNNQIALNINIITNYCTNWTDDEILLYLNILEYLIQENKFNNYKDIFIKNNTPISLFYYNKYKTNVLNCSIGQALSINCNTLTLPICCGLQYNVFTGGQFIIDNNQIIGIEALEGINGYLNQKFTNHFCQLDCVACENKYFCQKGCHKLQFDFNIEPYLPIKNICKLENSRINFLIQKFHDLKIFHKIFINNLLDDNSLKIQLIKLLVNKGYYEYGRYAE